MQSWELHTQALGKELYGAARSGHLPQVQALLAQRADLNFISGDGWSPLMMTCLSTAGTYLEIAQALIAAGADMNHKDSRGRSALFFAAKSGDATLVELFKNADDLNAHDNYRVSPLNVAVRNDNPAVAKLLISMRADVNYGDSFGGTPLQGAKISKNAALREAFGLDPSPQTTTRTTTMSTDMGGEL